MPKIIGAHLSISNGIHTVQEQMDLLELDTCAIFLKNQKRYSSAPLSDAAAQMFRQSIRHPEIILPHSSYLVNLAVDSAQKGMECFIDDLKRCNSLGIKMYNIHPGSSKGKCIQAALATISKNINIALAAVPDVIVLIENMAGQGNVVASNFEQIRDIIDAVDDKQRVGVCLDTCHLFGAGFDIRTEEQFAEIIRRFDQTVGMQYLKAMHINDSKQPLGSRKDRHESIGKGLIGCNAFRFIMNSNFSDDIPLILETPDQDMYKHEANLLRGFINI
ncbi:xylose isomerase-like [Ordospora pajunii]|uniref:xylose isomerase-like n=1 Tax=Ordospora pajunii TaxID=3039483 RepID=UPI0029528441|nr:xylose isomerase-like [Ordospora pajunii]KAH9410686.1 xylose isomerase-like [Ordospora pajunii]